MNLESLEGIGLSKTEGKVFVTLLKTGESKAGLIITESSLHSSSVHNSLNSLIKKGLISYIKKNRIKFYKAASPETILNYIDTKKVEYMKLLPQLEELKKGKQKTEVEFFKSIKGIKTMMFLLLETSKEKDIYRTFVIGDAKKYQQSIEKVFFSVKHILKKKKIVTKGIFPEELRSPTKKSSIMQKRYVSFPIPPNINIIGDKISLISWEDEPFGMLIHSKEIANSYKNFFDHVYKMAKA